MNSKRGRKKYNFKIGYRNEEVRANVKIIEELRLQDA